MACCGFLFGYSGTAHRMFMLEGENTVDPEEERMREAGILAVWSEIRDEKRRCRGQSPRGSKET